MVLRKYLNEPAFLETMRAYHAAYFEMGGQHCPNIPLYTLADKSGYTVCTATVNSLNSSIGSQLASSNPDNPYLANWSLEKVLNKSNTDSYHSFADLLAHSSLSKLQVNRLLGFIREDPDDYKTPYLRWVIISQKGLTLTPDQQKLLEGSTYKYECRQTSSDSYSCDGDY